MSQAVLDRFGELVMFHRDWVIREFEHEVEGTNPAIKQTKRHESLVALTEEQRAIVRREVIDGIDRTIHHLLWMFEQHDVNEFDVVYVGTDEDSFAAVSVSDLSDGLGGEPFTEDGWIAKYSKYEDFMPRLIDGVWRDTGED